MDVGLLLHYPTDGFLTRYYPLVAVSWTQHEIHFLAVVAPQKVAKQICVMMMMMSAPSDGSTAAYGDIALADVFESVACWLPVSRSTLNALSHSCHARSLPNAASPRLRIRDICVSLSGPPAILGASGRIEGPVFSGVAVLRPVEHIRVPLHEWKQNERQGNRFNRIEIAQPCLSGPALNES